MRKPKFKKGAQVKSLNELIDLILYGSWVYWADRPKHPNVLANMTVSSLRAGIRAGVVFEAEENL